MQLYLAYKDDKLAGTIAAINNDTYNELRPEEGGTGFFGFFECINDQDVANALFDAVKAWLKKRNLTKMQGPASPTSNYVFGMLTKGFDDSPRIDMPYNPSYYPTLAENYGLPRQQGLVAYKVDAKTVYDNAKLNRGAAAVKKRYNVEIRPLNMKDIYGEVKKIIAVYNKAWEPLWGTIPQTDEEIDGYADKFKMIAIPELIPFIYVDGKLAGMAVAVLDFNFILKKMKGRLFPHGYKIFTEQKNVEWIRVIALGLFPEYQGKGIDAVAYKHLVDTALEKGFKYCEGSAIWADNEMMNRGMNAVSGEIYKEYQVYEMGI